MNYAALLRLKAARMALCLSTLAFVSAASWPIWGELNAPVPQATAAQRLSPIETMISFYTDRNALREEEIAQLTALSEQEGTSDEIRTMAQRRILNLRDWMEKEATVEAVLEAHGFRPVLVTVHADSANVLVATERIDRADAQVMLELVARETGIAGGNIKIIPIN